jgi:gliding motility-associated lipoprotein GldH
MASCSFQSLFESTADIPGGIWNQGNKIFFEVPVTDTINNFNIIFTIRNNDEYPRSNIYLFVDTKSPNGNAVRDTMEIELCDSKGHWYGKGIGGLWQNKVYYQKNVRFPVSGLYTISLAHAMRYENLEGITDLGIMVEHSKK